MDEKFQPQTFNINNINGGKRYQNGYGVNAESINSAIEASAFAQALATNQPDTFEAGLVGTPSVSIVNAGNGTPRLKFSQLRGKDGVSPHIGENGNWWVGDEDTGISAGISKTEFDWYKSFIANGTVGLAYESNGTAWACTGIGTATVTDIVISSHILGLPVNVGEWAFRYNRTITGVVIPKGSIRNQAFYYASNVTSVTLGEGVTSIGAAAFCGCSKLTSVTIPDSVTSIAGSVFYDCIGLQSVTIGSGVKSIPSQMFYGCRNLKRVDLSSATSVPTLTLNALGNTHADLQIKVPTSLYEQWKVATNWSEYADKIVTEFTNEV